MWQPYGATLPLDDHGSPDSSNFPDSNSSKSIQNDNRCKRNYEDYDGVDVIENLHLMLYWSKRKVNECISYFVFF